jgi:hypothetical protein
VFATSELAADASFDGKTYAVIARRTGIMPLRGFGNGFEGMAAGFRLIRRWLRKDTRFDVMVWNRTEVPLDPPRFREEVPTRSDASARVKQLVAEIEAGRIPTDPDWRPRGHHGDRSPGGSQLSMPGVGRESDGRWQSSVTRRPSTGPEPERT